MKKTGQNKRTESQGEESEHFSENRETPLMSEKKGTEGLDGEGHFPLRL
jgi:hypothetical protein